VGCAAFCGTFLASAKRKLEFRDRDEKRDSQPVPEERARRPPVVGRCEIASAAAGGQVLGPAGAIVGGTVGAAFGAAAEIPHAFITSVERANAPSVVVRERIVVGERLPSMVHLRSVPAYPNYRYAVVNDQRVIVEPRTRRIIHILQ
jgi:hypothetical protein